MTSEELRNCLMYNVPVRSLSLRKDTGKLPTDGIENRACYKDGRVTSSGPNKECSIWWVTHDDGTRAAYFEDELECVEILDAPIRVYPKPYRGRDPKKLEKHRKEFEAARILEQHLNSRRVPNRPTTFTYHELADETGIDYETVHDLLHRLRGGSNGITI